MSIENKGNGKGRFDIYAKRPTDKKWSIWTNTDDLEILINNIRTIEEHGNQWKVTDAFEQKRITDVEKATQEGYLKGYSEGCSDASNVLSKELTKKAFQRIIQYVGCWVGIVASLEKSTMLWEMCQDLKGIAKNEFGIELESEGKE